MKLIALICILHRLIAARFSVVPQRRQFLNLRQAWNVAQPFKLLEGFVGGSVRTASHVVHRREVQFWSRTECCRCVVNARKRKWGHVTSNKNSLQKVKSAPCGRKHQHEATRRLVQALFSVRLKGFLTQIARTTAGLLQASGIYDIVHARHVHTWH